MKIKNLSLIMFFASLSFTVNANANKLEEQDQTYVVKGVDQVKCQDYLYYANKHGTSRLNGLVLSNDEDYDRIIIKDLVFTKYFNLSVYLNNKKSVRMIDLEDKNNVITFYDKPYIDRKLKRGGKKYILTFKGDNPEEYTLEIFKSSGLNIKKGEFFEKQVFLAVKDGKEISKITYKVNTDYENSKSRYVSNECEKNIKELE